MSEPLKPTPYNPLDKINLGKSVADALLEQVALSLPLGHVNGSPTPFIGAGVYVLYYSGDHELYEPVSAANRITPNSRPIYIGKAVSSGARKGGLLSGDYTTMALYSRLKQHATTIDECTNLNLEDFHCRYLVVDDIWIPLGETLLIEQFKPVWNSVVDGFGIHDPGKGRAGQKKSMWDTLHPGRKFAGNLQANIRFDHQIAELLKAHYLLYPQNVYS